MERPSRFTIHSLLVLTAFVAFAFLPLVTPSVKWALLLPTFGCFLSVYGTSRIVSSPEHGRVFWASFLVGVGVYIAGVALVGFFCTMRGGFAQIHIWDEYVGTPLWVAIHGDGAFTSNRSGILNEDFLSFLAWVHVILAMMISAISAALAQLFATWRK